MVGAQGQCGGEVAGVSLGYGAGGGWFLEGGEELHECDESGGGEAETEGIFGEKRAGDEVVASGEEGTRAGEESVEGGRAGGGGGGR